MIARRTTRLLPGTLGLCTLFAALAMPGEASAFTRIRTYSGERNPMATCSVNYGTITDTVAYQSGPVISNVQAVPVFWTSGVDASVQAFAEGYLGALVNSDYMDLLAQYSTAPQSGGTGQTIGRGTVLPAVTITPTTATGTTVQDSAIGPELQAQITAQHLPAPTNDAQGYPNTLYVLFFPQSILVNYGGLSCQGFCGYHGAYPANGNATFAYAVIPDMGTGSGCATGCSDQCTTGDTAVMVGTISHELAEAVSDPANTPGWVNPNQSSQNSEIGDICTGNGKTQTDTGPVPGTSILAQYEWSQRDKQCLLANPGVDAGSGSSSGGSSGGSSGSSSGSSSGGSSGGSSGSGSSSGGSSGSGSGSSSGSSSGGAHGVDGGSSGGSSDAGSGNFDTPASSTGCGCSEAGQTTSGAAMAGLALLGVLGVARRRRR